MLTNIEIETMTLAKSFFKEMMGFVHRQEKPTKVEIFPLGNDSADVNKLVINDFLEKVVCVDVKICEKRNEMYIFYHEK